MKMPFDDCRKKRENSSPKPKENIMTPEEYKLFQAVAAEVRALLTELDEDKFPVLSSRGLDWTQSQIANMLIHFGYEPTEVNIHSCMVSLESDLEEMFPVREKHIKPKKKEKKHKGLITKEEFPLLWQRDQEWSVNAVMEILNARNQEPTDKNIYSALVSLESDLQKMVPIPD